MASTAAAAPPRALEFAYDIACPYAYLASTQVEDVALRCGAKLIWTPVLLGGLYELSRAPQGKGGSATDMMPEAKRQILSHDLLIQVEHVGAPFLYNTKHPIRTVAALRLILSTPEALRPSITHDLFKAYWVNNLDVSHEEVLQVIADRYEVPLTTIYNEEVKGQLHYNTTHLADMGAFGVPCFIVNGRFYWGQDRLFLVERALGRTSAYPRQILRSVNQQKPHTLVFYHDFSSPWSFLASLQVAALARETGVKLLYKPFLVGALFKSIGTPVVPLSVVTASRASYFRQDLADWSSYLGANLKFPSVFPIRSVLALRVALCDSNVTDVIYHAAWVEDKEIADRSVLHKVLKEAGFDAHTLLEQANSQEVKEQLKELTNEVLLLGACGAPTFQILDPNGQHIALIWGQDRLNVIADMLRGWRPKADIHKDGNKHSIDAEKSIFSKL